MTEKIKKDLEHLRFKKSGFLKKITTLHQLCLNLIINSDDHSDFEVRFSKLEHDYKSLNQCQSDIVKLLISLDLSSEIEDEEKSIDLVDEMYFRILASHKKLLNGEGNLNQTVGPHQGSQVRLPKIDLPIFSGDLKDWPHFKDLYTSLVHNNESTTDIEKFHYLVSCLRAEPHSLAKTLPLTAQNYKIIWKQIIERYDNKRLLAACYVEEILNAPQVSNESPKKLRQLLDISTENAIALRAMNFPVDYGDFLLCYVILQKLDKHTRQLFERKCSTSEFPTLDNVFTFLKDHCKSLEAASPLDKSPSTSSLSGIINRSKHSKQFQPKSPPNNRVTHAWPQSLPRNALLSTNKSTYQCLFCNENHTIYRCQQFASLTIHQRKDFIISKQACFNCLSPGHSSKSCCSSTLCKKCSRHHHTMLHEPPLAALTPAPLPQTPARQNSVQPTSQTEISTVPVASHVGSSSSTTLLGTAAIQVRDYSGHFQTIRALLDPGSQVSFITEDCLSKLSLPRKKFTAPVQGISQSVVQTSQGIVNCFIKPRFKNHPCLQTSAVILKHITSPLPSRALPNEVKQYFQNLDLADPFFDIPGKIDFLIGADLYPEVCDGGRKLTKVGYPTPIRTIFGWILMGKTMTHSPSNMLTTHLTIAELNNLDNSLKKFWEIEEPPSKVHISPDDQKAELMYVSSHERLGSGRYVVKLPFHCEPPDLGESYNYANQSFSRLEARLNRNPQLKTQYTQFMTEYLELGHMRPIDLTQVQPKYFIPHHGVFKMGQDAKTPQLRVVFNASAKTTSGKSLNDELLTGPKLQNDICKIISNFRLYPVVFTADICKMYRQVIIHPDHQEYQAILWRSSSQEPVSCYLLNTVTYGTSSAPYLAIRTLQQLAHDQGQSFPLAAKSLINDIFVDDLLVGSDSLEEALLLKSDLISLLKLGGFELKKWATNCPELVKDVIESHKEVNFNSDTPESDTIKVLGIKWKTSTDCFSYQVHIKEHKATKRCILSLISSIFDPLGWVTPTILWAKILIQSLWTSGVDWDDPLNTDLGNSWLRFVSELPQLESLQIPRLVLASNHISLQLHGFCDGSTKGYGACLYLRSESINGTSINLVLAKSKVAPLKSLSIPKLELCGTVLLSKLVEFYTKTIPDKFGTIPVFAWTDSTIALNWIHTSPHLLKTFIANRVALVQDIIHPSRWCHTPTNDNPADCSSRGLLPSQLISHTLWWQGPTWLAKDSSAWPAQTYPHIPKDELPEIKSPVISAIVTEKETASSFMERFSSLTRLKRVISWCFRFTNNCRAVPDQRSVGPLLTSELNNTLNVCIKLTQQEHFQSEFIHIQSKTPCKPELQRLDPFIDADEIMRVGGRLRHSSLQFSNRHPILLPKDCHLTTLLIDHYHKTYFHVGPQTLQSLLQRFYWVLSARNTIRKRILKCVKCTRMKAECPQPFMADLPAYRVNQFRPFLKIGIDCGGPFLIKTERSRKPQIRKAYLCLFICLATKALHLEVVSDLSTDTFLAAFNRLIARRGLCTDVYSDRGTNFVGAKLALNELYKFLKDSKNSDDIGTYLANKGITWHLNPPSAPHFGGIWEAGIKSVKHHLLHVIGDQVLTFEELATLFIQIEAILNSRPLSPLSSDATETDVLTPGHFLIGQPIVCIPQPDLTELPQNRLSRWQLLNQARQHFWKRWSSEYLHTLQQRSKWTTRTSNFEVGTLVLIKENNLPPQTWRMGRITSVLPGSDGIVRVAKLWTSRGELIRPVVKLCPLPVQEF